MNSLTLPIENRDHMRGSANPRVVLLEYGDYESPTAEGRTLSSKESNGKWLTNSCLPFGTSL